MYYFAYGSNMDPSQMKTRCPAAVRVTRARLQGYRFSINTRGVATIHKERGQVVYGMVYRITPACEATLDKCEGVSQGLYGKHIVRVNSLRRDSVRECLTYIDPDPFYGLPRTGYLEKIVRGALFGNLPASYIKKLNEWRFYAA